MKKVLVIGSTGLLGSAIVAALRSTHEVVGASRSSQSHVVDISDPASIKALFNKVGKVDAVICTAGQVKFKALEASLDEDWSHGLTNKLMGQINVVRFGAGFVNQGGSMVLTSGVLSQYPMPGSSMVTTVNAGVEGFVKAAALEFKGRIGIHAISPGWVTETLAFMKMDTSMGTPAEEVAQAYLGLLATYKSGEIKVVAKG